MRRARLASTSTKIVTLVAYEATRNSTGITVRISTRVTFSLSIVGTMLAHTFLCSSIKAVARRTTNVAATVSISSKSRKTSLTIIRISCSTHQTVSNWFIALVADTLTIYKDVSCVTSSTVVRSSAGPTVIVVLTTKWTIACAINEVTRSTAKTDEATISIGCAWLTIFNFLSTN